MQLLLLQNLSGIKVIYYKHILVLCSYVEEKFSKKYVK